MPFPVAAAIAAGSALASSGMQAVAQGKTNKQSRRHAIYMYDRQRADSLADFAMQNEYNSPVSQMKRFKEAGLNPNLIYGNGATAGDASPIKAAQTGSYNPTPPKLDIGGAASAGISTYYDTQIKQATIDNLKKQNTVLTQEAALKQMQTASTAAGTANTQQQTETSKYDLQFKKDIRDTQVSALALANEQTSAQIQQIGANTTATTDSNKRANQLQPSAMANAMEDILTKQSNRLTNATNREATLQAIENAKKDGTLKDFDIKLREMGIYPGDPWYIRDGKRLVEGISQSVPAKGALQGSGQVAGIVARILEETKKALGL